MRPHKVIVLLFATLILTGCPEKSPKKSNLPSEPQSTNYLEEVTCPDQDSYCFKVVDKADPSTVKDLATYAISREYFIDEDGAKFLGGTNPSFSFHPDQEMLVVKTRLKGKPLPNGHKPLAQASQAKEKLSNNKGEEESAFLFTNRRLDLPFILLETYRGRGKIADAVNNLLDSDTETRAVEFYLQPQNTNNNPFTKLVTLSLSSALKSEDLPRELLDYLQD